jgi:signal transduction histidine kinase
MNDVIEFFRGLFATSLWPPRWKCGYWSDFHGWLYVISELLIWTAYFLIPLIILNYISRKKATLKFQRAYVYFAAFILLCGSTHFLDALMFWIPMYRLNAVIRVVTAIISLVTVYHLVKILPQAFSQKTNIELEGEIARREEAERKLEAAVKDLEAFAHIASHDLQEPLRKVGIYCSMLSAMNDKNFNDESKELSNKIMKAAGRMQEMVNDTLTLATITGEAEMHGLNPEESIRNAMVDLEMKILEKNAVIHVSPLPPVKGNEAYLSQLFLNLIGNAIKFSAKRPEINISGKKMEEVVIITVSDNGIGMKESDLTKIFNAFQRLNAKQDYEGSGIGLAICKKIIDVHHGKISVESEPGIGSRFTIELPAA